MGCKSFILFLLSLFLTGTVSAQKNNQISYSSSKSEVSSEITTSPKNSPKSDRHDSAGINISLWKNISTQRTDTFSNTYFNLGFFSFMNRLNGLGVNILGSTTNKDVNGLQLSGLSNVVKGSMRGVQVSGICNINGNNLTGLSASGLVGIAGNNAQGALFSTLVNITGNNSRGFIIGGLLNISGENSSGVHFAGLANISGGDFKGVASSGVLNVVGKNFKGVQLAGLASITGEDMHGVQISGIGNVVGNKVNGLQISPLNVGTHVKGVQVGLFNYYTKSLKGFQLGLINANPQTTVQMMLFGGNTTKINIGARFKNKLFYTILGGGTHYLDFGDKFSAAAFYRGGVELPLYKQLFISGDLGYQHIETFKNRHYGIPSRLYALQARLNLEYRPSNYWGIFFTGGYNNSRYYTKAATYDKGVIIEGGVVFFKM